MQRGGDVASGGKRLQAGRPRTVFIFLRWPRRATGDQEQHARQHGSAHNECDAEPDVGFGDGEEWASRQDAVLYSTGINGDARDRENTDDTTDEDKKREPDQ